MQRRFLLIFCFLIIPFLQLIGEENPHVRLLIKIPTRDRYERFFETLDQYYQKLSNNVSYHFVVSCDLDDRVMNSQRAIEKLKSYPNLSFYFGIGKSKIEACNRDIDRHPNFDIVMLASDDMIPVVDGFDEVISDAMYEYFPDNDGVLHFNDGHVGDVLNTLSILGKNYYDKFGYIYHPKYRSFWCDNEFMLVSRQLNKAVYIDTVIIEHRHYVYGENPNDNLYKRNEKQFKHDEKVFKKRQKDNFGLPQVS